MDAPTSPGDVWRYQGKFYFVVEVIHSTNQLIRMLHPGGPEMGFSTRSDTWLYQAEYVGTFASLCDGLIALCTPPPWLDDEVERLNPVSGGRWLCLPVTAAEGEDTRLSCLCCGLPRAGLPRSVFGFPSGSHLGSYLGPRVEYLVCVRNHGTTTWRGLHKACWEQNRDAVNPLVELTETRATLDVANRLIGEAADEASFLDEALSRAEAKVERLYRRGADTTAALHDERAALGNLCRLSVAVVADDDAEILRLRNRVSELEDALAHELRNVASLTGGPNV